MEEQRAILSTRSGFLFLLPATIFIAIFLIFPFLWIFYLSFTNQTLTGATSARPSFVGLSNYLSLFDFQHWLTRGQFGSSLIITAEFVVGSGLVGQVVLGLSLAIAFYRRKGTLREIVYTLVIMAWIIPEVVVAFAWVAFLDRDNGTLNLILSQIGLGHPDWQLQYALPSIIIFNTWRGTAFSMLLFSSALATIPPSYLETAEVAGASTWQKLRDILLPLLRGHILTDLILITLWTFNTFTPFLITNGGPAFKTEVISIFTYRIAFQFFDFGLGAAIAVVVMLINLALALIYLGMLRRQAVYA
ncbi:MAG: sugar ABC transporter permease [Ardenticatenaceae bacterium]|nr:sugar ABC transporter permease [Ardenticatenaceae bacterium]HBY96080.1 ABC transporter permease [Chloroflexota bacterium]